MQENRLDEQKLKQARELNIEEDFKDIDEDDVKQNPIKDTVGHWTDKQIRENPEAYIKYLQGKLKSAIARQDLQEIKELISEISKIQEKYLLSHDNLEKGRIR